MQIQGDDWFPIDTAPVDGRDILVKEENGDWGIAFCSDVRRQFFNRDRTYWSWKYNNVSCKPVLWKELVKEYKPNDE